MDFEAQTLPGPHVDEIYSEENPAPLGVHPKPGLSVTIVIAHVHSSQVAGLYTMTGCSPEIPDMVCILRWQRNEEM